MTNETMVCGACDTPVVPALCCTYCSAMLPVVISWASPIASNEQTDAEEVVAGYLFMNSPIGREQSEELAREAVLQVVARLAPQLVVFAEATAQDDFS